MVMDVSQRAEEIRNHRFDGYTDNMLANEIDLFRGGAGTNGIGEAVNALKAVSKALNETENTLRTELGKLGVDWTGDAGEQAQRWLTGQADYSRDAHAQVEEAAKQIFAQGEAFNRTMHQLPDAKALREGSGGYGFADALGSLIGFETDNAKRVAQGQEARAQALEALNGYARSSGDNLSSLPQMEQPEMMAAFVSDVPREVDAGGPPATDGGSDTPDVQLPATDAPDSTTDTSGVAPPAAAPVVPPASAPVPPAAAPVPTPTPTYETPYAAPPVGTGSVQPGGSHAGTAPSSTAPSSSAPVQSAPGAGYLHVARPGGRQPVSGNNPSSGSAQGPVSGTQAVPGTPGTQTPQGTQGLQGTQASPGATPGGQTGAGGGAAVGKTPGAPVGQGTPAGPGTPGGTDQAPGNQTGGKQPGAVGGKPGALPGAGTPAAPGTATPGGGGAVAPAPLVGGKAGGPVSESDQLAKGKSFGVAPMPGGGTTGAGNASSAGMPKAGGISSNDLGGAAGAVAAGGIAGALAGDRDRSGGGRSAAPRSPHQNMADLPEEQARAERNRADKAGTDRRGVLQKAAPQEGDDDATHVRRFGVDDNDLFSDQRMVAPDTIGDPDSEQR